MTVLDSFGAALGSTRGPVSVSPDRLLSFSRASLLSPAKGALSGGSTGVPIDAISGGAITSATAQDSSNKALRYRFRINPNRLSVRHEVLERYILTKAGFERQDWGNGLSSFSYAGNTGVFRPDVTAAESAQKFPDASFDIRETPAWKRFKEFETFYRSSRGTNVFMYYVAYDHEWEGSLSQFSFEQSADRPFSIDYHFVFTGMPFNYPVTQASLNASTFDSAIQQRAASTSPALGSGGGGTGSRR